MAMGMPAEPDDEAGERRRAPAPLFARETRPVAALEWALALLPFAFFLVGLIVPK